MYVNCHPVPSFLLLTQDSELMPQLQSMSIEIGHLSLMVDALCEADGLGELLSLSDNEDGSALASSTQNILEMPSESDVVFEGKHG